MNQAGHSAYHFYNTVTQKWKVSLVGVGVGLGVGWGRGRGRGRGSQVHRRIPDEIRATIVDHVVNHGLTMAEAGRRVQPNVGRTTVN